MAENVRVCKACGRPLPEQSEYCLACGTQQAPRPVPKAPRAFPLRRAVALAGGTALLLALAAGIFFLTRPEPTSAAPETAPSQPEPSVETAEAAALLLTGPDASEEPVTLEAEAPVETPQTRESAAPVPSVTAPVAPPETLPAETREEPAPADYTDADGTLHHGDLSVKILNDLSSETGNYFAYTGEGRFQTFRVISGALYTAGDTLRLRGSATAVTPAEVDDKVELWFFYAGQNQVATAPLLKKTVTVLKTGVNEGVTASFDLDAASWSALAATGHKEFLLYLADL